MITRVARAFGRSPMAVARAPFAETAWIFGQLADLERADGLLREGEELRAADLQSVAFHEPKKLETARRNLMSRLRAGPGRALTSPAEAKARAQRMVDRMRRSGVVADFDVTAPPET